MALFLLFLPVLAALGGPEVDAPIVGAFQGEELVLTGGGFGAPGPGSHLVLQSGSVTQEVPSTSPFIATWQDDRVVLALEDDSPSGWARVVTPAGASAPVRVELFRYDWFDIPPTAGTNAHPLSIAVDPLGRVWVNQEFHLELQLLDPAVGSVVGLPIPKPPDPGVFATTIFGDHPTQTSALGEDVIVDPEGRIWFSQGGGYLYSGAYPNHSRIVCYDPDAPAGSEYRVYNVPGDWNEVIGLAWDPVREWIWFTNGGLVSGARIIGFDPEQIPFDNHYDFATDLLHQLCFPGAPEDACYHVYDLPNPTAQPAHLLLDDAGGVWFTAYWGRAIGRLDPATSEVLELPLPPTISEAEPAIFVGPGPWQIKLGPDGNVYFNEFFDSTLACFDVGRLGDPACLKLTPEGENPCITDLVIPDADLENEQVHSIDFDAKGNLWYTIHTADEPGGGGSLGFVSGKFRHVVRLPSLGIFPGTGAATADGVAVDRTSGDVWFAEFWRKRVGRLQPVAEF